jgi:thiol-disulfide isomerase/thioredoxin
MKHLASSLLVALLTLAGALAQNNPDADNTLAMPDFQAKALDGSQVDTTKLRGQVVLLDIWAVWCAPCIQSAPALDRMYQELKPEGLEMIGIAVQSGTEEKVRSTASKLGMTYPILLWDDELAKKIKGIEAVPTYILVNRDWRVEKIFVGATKPSMIREHVERALAEAPTPEEPSR